jgi:hypothetical protein
LDWIEVLGCIWIGLIGLGLDGMGVGVGGGKWELYMLNSWVDDDWIKDLLGWMGRCSDTIHDDDLVIDYVGTGIWIERVE